MTTARAEFHRVMAERRAFAPGSVDHTYRSRAARRLVWIIKGISTEQWETLT